MALILMGICIAVSSSTSMAQILDPIGNATQTDPEVLVFSKPLTCEFMLSQTWKSSTPKFTEKERSLLYNVSSNELYPIGKTTVKVNMSIPEQTSGSFEIHVASKAVEGSQLDAVAIQNVDIYNKSNDLCISYNMSYSNPNDMTSAQVTLRFVYLTGTGPSGVDIFIVLKVDFNKAKQEDKHLVSLSTSQLNVTYEISLTLNMPQVLQDSEGVISSQLYKLLDGNLSSCLHLPVQGEFPPLFWMRMKTISMNISSTSYSVMVVGEDISCNPHGSRLLQVSYPVSSGSPSRSVFCSLNSQNSTNKGMVECGYRCNCTNSLECQEIIIFMANHEQNTLWSLCELIAHNES